MDFDKSNPTGNIWNFPIVCSKPLKTVLLSNSNSIFASKLVASVTVIQVKSTQTTNDQIKRGYKHLYWPYHKMLAFEKLV
jgi:hypothetical protein